MIFYCKKMNRTALKKLKRMIALNCLTKTGKKKKPLYQHGTRGFQKQGSTRLAHAG